MVFCVELLLEFVVGKICEEEIVPGAEVGDV